MGHMFATFLGEKHIAHLKCDDVLDPL